MKKKSKAGRKLKFKEKTTTIAFRLPVSEAEKMKAEINRRIARMERRAQLTNPL